MRLERATAASTRACWMPPAVLAPLKHSLPPRLASLPVPTRVVVVVVRARASELGGAGAQWRALVEQEGAAKVVIIL